MTPALLANVNPSAEANRKPTRVVVTYFEAGGGHRAAALALQSVLSLEPGWEVELLNLQEYLDALDPSRRLTGVRVQDIYNRMLNRGSTRLMRILLPMLHAAIRFYTPLVKTQLAKYWRQGKPDVVVSVVPNLNRAIANSVAEAIPHTPFVTLLTDFADTPPHFWIEEQSQYLLCGTRRAAEQALAMGHGPERVIQTSGMILHPRFYCDQQEDRTALRSRLGLTPDCTTVLVMFGGQGSYEMMQIAESLSHCGSPIQVVYICGRNEVLRQKLERLTPRSSGVVLGFTTEVPAYMAASDLMIGKPGPGSVSEALHFGLPVIVCRNGSTMPQEIYNTYWIEKKEVGLVLRDFRCVDQQLDSLLNDGRLERMKASAKAVKNEAIFEVPKILKDILATHQIAS